MKEEVGRVGTGYQMRFARRSRVGPVPHLLAIKQSPVLLSEAPGAKFKTTKKKSRGRHKGCHTDTQVWPRPHPRRAGPPGV